MKNPITTRTPKPPTNRSRFIKKLYQRFKHPIKRKNKGRLRLVDEVRLILRPISILSLLFLLKIFSL